LGSLLWEERAWTIEAGEEPYFIRERYVGGKLGRFLLGEERLIHRILRQHATGKFNLTERLMGAHSGAAMGSRVRLGHRLDVSRKFAQSVPLGPALSCRQPLHLLRMHQLTVIFSKPTLTVRRRAYAGRGDTNYENQDHEIHQATHRALP